MWDKVDITLIMQEAVTISRHHQIVSIYTSIDYGITLPIHAASEGLVVQIDLVLNTFIDASWALLLYSEVRA
jgi:hypothetical protein